MQHKEQQILAIRMLTKLYRTVWHALFLFGNHHSCCVLTEFLLGRSAINSSFRRSVAQSTELNFRFRVPAQETINLTLSKFLNFY